MRLFQILLLLFIAIPIVEIYLLISVGEVIGAPATIALVILTAAIGVFLLRLQGLSTAMRVRETMERGGLPALEMMEGVVLLLAGALLLTPGFFTDALGFLALITPLRRAVLLKVVERMVIVRGGPGGHAGGSGPYTIDGEYRREDEGSDSSNDRHLP